MLEGHQATQLEAALKWLLPQCLGMQNTVGLNQLEDGVFSKRLYFKNVS